MSVLVLADHDNASLKPATLNAITAAAKLGEVHVLVAGQDCDGAAKAAAAVAGVAKVLKADAAPYRNPLAENVAPLVAKLAAGYSHVLSAATTVGKNIMPRVAATLDVQQISAILTVESADTFVRPIYAGNALATVQSKDAIKVITVRGTAFAPAATTGGSAAIEALCRRPECVGVGETGLDYFKEHAPRAAQLESFYWQLDLARRLDKPVVVHCRDAWQDTARILAEFQGVRGVMHCYTYGPAELEPFLAAGFCISFSGVVTYPRNDENRAAAALVPEERLLVETDSPFLAPQAARGRRNEPAFVRHVLDTLARVRGADVGELARATSRNAAALFGLP